MLESPVLIINVKNGHKHNTTVDAATSAVAGLKVVKNTVNTAAGTVVSASNVVVASSDASASSTSSSSSSLSSLSSSSSSINASASKTKTANMIGSRIDHTHNDPVVSAHNHRRNYNHSKMNQHKIENSKVNEKQKNIINKADIKVLKETCDKKYEITHVDYYTIKYCPPKDESKEADKDSKNFLKKKHSFKAQNEKQQNTNGIFSTNNHDILGKINMKNSSKKFEFRNKTNEDDSSQMFFKNSTNNDNLKDKKFMQCGNSDNKNFHIQKSDKNKKQNVKQTKKQIISNDFNNDSQNSKLKDSKNYQKNSKFIKESKNNVQLKVDEMPIKIVKKHIFYSEMNQDEIFNAMKKSNGQTCEEEQLQISKSKEKSLLKPKRSALMKVNTLNDEPVLREHLDVISGGIAISLPLLPTKSNNPIVTCCLVLHPGHFYVRFDNSAFESLNSSMNSFYGEDEDGHIELSADCIKSGQYYAASRRENHWIRVQILQIQSSEIIHCSLIDDAGIEVFKVSQLQPLYNQFRTVPKQALRCELNRVKPEIGDDWPVEAALQFKDLFTNKQFRIDSKTIFDQSEYEKLQYLHVYDLLITEDNDKSIVELLIEKKLASLRT